MNKPRRLELAALVLACAMCGVAPPAAAARAKAKPADSRPLQAAPAELAEGRALLAVAFDAESPVEHLKLVPVDAEGEPTGRPFTLYPVEVTGYSIAVFELSASAYRIKEMRVAGAYGGKIGFDAIEPMKLEAAQLNYVGDIRIKRHDGHVDVVLANRIGRFMSELLARHRDFSTAYPVRYAGQEGDDWSSSLFESR